MDVITVLAQFYALGRVVEIYTYTTVILVLVFY